MAIESDLLSIPRNLSPPADLTVPVSIAAEASACPGCTATDKRVVVVLWAFVCDRDDCVWPGREACVFLDAGLDACTKAVEQANESTT